MNFWPLKKQIYTPFCYYHNFLTTIECDAIKSIGNSLSFEDGLVYDKNSNDIVKDDVVRKNKLAFFSPPDKVIFSWIYKKCTDMIFQANEEFFEYNLTLIEPLQYTIYNNLNDHYLEHMDIAITPMQRKLSFSIQLDSEDSYEGCDLIFSGYEKNENFRKQGTIVFFNSLMRHQVTPLISGVRRSLVGWVCGPNFK
jgi:PKHD-type hydroxylase